MADMAREGVDAQVIFPEAGLGLCGGEGSREYHVAISQAYNDWVLEAFAPEPERFRSAALIPTDDADAARRMLRVLLKAARIPDRIDVDDDGARQLYARENGGWREVDSSVVYADKPADIHVDL